MAFFNRTKLKNLRQVLTYQRNKYIYLWKLTVRGVTVAIAGSLEVSNTLTRNASQSARHASGS